MQAARRAARSASELRRFVAPSRHGDDLGEERGASPDSRNAPAPIGDPRGPATVVEAAGKRGEALEDIESLVPRIEEHLEKLRQNPTSQDVPGWHDELNAWIGKIERLVDRGLGKKTDEEMRQRVAGWRSRQASVPDPRVVNLRGAELPGVGGASPLRELDPTAGLGGAGRPGGRRGGGGSSSGTPCRKSLACPGR